VDSWLLYVEFQRQLSVNISTQTADMQLYTAVTNMLRGLMSQIKYYGGLEVCVLI